MAMSWKRKSPAGEESVLVEGVRTVERILAAADVRDAQAEARDAAADQRDRDVDLAELLGAAAGEYGADWPARRAAALDREHSRQDRVAAHQDLRDLADRLVARGESVQDNGLERL